MIYADRFLTNLRNRLTEDLTAKHRDLARGNAVVADNPAATGMQYARTVGVIYGLETALSHIQEIEAEMSAKPKKDERL